MHSDSQNGGRDKRLVKTGTVYGLVVTSGKGSERMTDLRAPLVGVLRWLLVTPDQDASARF